METEECTHDKYRDGYMSISKALADKNICWIGKVVNVCEDCNQDISKFKRVRAKTVEEYMRGL